MIFVVLCERLFDFVSFSSNLSYKCLIFNQLCSHLFILYRIDTYMDKASWQLGPIAVWVLWNGNWIWLRGKQWAWLAVDKTYQLWQYVNGNDYRASLAKRCVGGWEVEGGWFPATCLQLQRQVSRVPQVSAGELDDNMMGGGRLQLEGSEWIVGEVNSMLRVSAH